MDYYALVSLWEYFFSFFFFFPKTPWPLEIGLFLIKPIYVYKLWNNCWWKVYYFIVVKRSLIGNHLKHSKWDWGPDTSCTYSWCYTCVYWGQYFQAWFRHPQTTVFHAEQCELPTWECSFFLKRLKRERGVSFFKILWEWVQVSPDFQKFSLSHFAFTKDLH